MSDQEQVPHDPIKPKVEIDKDPVSPKTEQSDKTFGKRQRLAFLLVQTMKELNETLESSINRNLGQSEHTLKYIEDLVLSEEAFFKDTYADSFEKDGRDWGQYVPYQGEKLRSRRPVFDFGKQGVISGDAAIIAGLEALGTGGGVDVPLWRSGFWVRFKAPSNLDILEFDRLVSTHKYALGHETYGNVFSNDMVYTVNLLVDFAIRHISRTTLKDTRPNIIRKMLKVTDLFQFIGAFAAVIYPDGYPLSQPCTADIEQCTHTEEALISIPKLSITDRSRLTAEQIEFMHNPEIKRELKEVQDYQDKHVLSHVVYDVNPVFKLVIKDPSIEKFVSAGHAWINAIIQTSEKLFTEETRQNEREAFLQAAADTQDLCRYVHWIDTILIGDHKVVDDETIRKLMANVVSADNEKRLAVIEKIKAVKEEMTLTLFGIPKYPCPSCGKEPKGYPQEPLIEPINPIALFFILVGQRLTTIVENV